MKNIIGNLVLVMTLLTNYTSFGHTLTTQSQNISFDIAYGITAGSNTAADIVVELDDVTEREESSEYTIYYIEYTPTEGKDLSVNAFFAGDVSTEMVSVYQSSVYQIAIKISKPNNPPSTLEGVIQFTIRDMIIKPSDDTDYSTASQNDLVKEEDNNNSRQIEKISINLYPNPANQSLNLPQSIKVETIQFINLLSNKTTIRSTYQNTTINLLDLSEGIYLVRLKDENGQWYEQKLVIQH
jgi:hypothetical protein